MLLPHDINHIACFVAKLSPHRVAGSMPPLSLHLGTINVTSSVFNLQLDSASIMELESSVALGYSLTDIKPIEMLTSREAWVTRGVGCRISIQLWIDGERPSDERWRADTAETLGRVLKEAEVSPH